MGIAGNPIRQCFQNEVMIRYDLVMISTSCSLKFHFGCYMSPFELLKSRLRRLVQINKRYRKFKLHLLAFKRNDNKFNFVKGKIKNYPFVPYVNSLPHYCTMLCMFHSLTRIQPSENSAPWASFQLWHGLVSASSAAEVVAIYNFSSLFFSETTAPNISKLYIQLPYIGVYKNSSLHVDPIVDVDFIGL